MFKIPLGQEARMEQLTMADLDQALREFKVADNGTNGNYEYIKQNTHN